MIALTYAGVDPGAVVIESVHTHVTGITVATSWQLNDLANWTYLFGLELLDQIEKSDGGILFNLTWA